MQRVIVTVYRDGAPFGLDLELPAGLPAERLVELLEECLRHAGVPAQADGTEPVLLVAHPPGRQLQPNETLADAGVWDGARLVLRGSRT